jgi:hypothetical protein
MPNPPVSTDSPVSSVAPHFESTSPLPLDAVANSDYVGMGGSILCLIHCLAPQLVVLGSIGLGIGSFFASEAWVFFFWASCLMAVWHSSRKSLFVRSSRFLWVAFGIFSLGTFLEFFGEFAHSISYVGSLALILAHLYNLHLHQQMKRSSPSW